MAALKNYQSELLKPYGQVTHGFFTRHGGVSSGPFDSLNFGMSRGDTLDNVVENKRRLSTHFNVPEEHVILMHQVHGNEIHLIEAPCFLEGDGLITSKKGFVLGVLTADCVPLLAYVPELNIIAAVHAGWRGAQKGVVFSMLRSLGKFGVKPSQVHCVIGPCIHQTSYEVDQTVFNEFSHVDSRYSKYFKANDERQGHYLFDLPGLVKGQLEREGVHQIDAIDLDTYVKEDEFFSCRRSAHRDSQAFGNQISAICLKD